MEDDLELAKLEAELADAKRELAELNAGVAAKKPAKKAKKPAKPARRPIHHSELRRAIDGFGGPASVGDRVRLNMTPVVTKQYDPADRPVEYKYIPKCDRN